MPIRVDKIKPISSPADLTITCGAAKTLVLDTAVYREASVPSTALQTGGTLPGMVELTDNAGAGTGVYLLGFADGEEGSAAITIPPDYEEGTDITFRVFWAGNDAPSGTDNVKWNLHYSVIGHEETVPAAATLSVETAYDTQYELMRSTFAAITGTTFSVGDQVVFTLERDTAAGDAYAGEALVSTVGFTYEADTIGSRTETAK